MSVKDRILKELNDYLAPKVQRKPKCTRRPATPEDIEHFRKLTEKHLCAKEARES